MSSSDLHAALAAGVTIVTPNNRLARAIVARHDAAMARAGKRAWHAARVLPWGAWITTLWQDAQDADALDPATRLLSPAAVHYLWERLVAARAADAQPLLDTRGAAALAVDAWELVHAWGAGGESWRAWRDSHEAPPGSDPAAFAAWAEAYTRDLERLSALDPAQLPDALAEVASRVGHWRDREIILLGFLEFTPQQRRLLACLADAGMRVREHSTPAAPGRIARASAPTPREEIRTALAWARRSIEENPDARIGIAIEDLAARRDEVLAIAEDVLCPALQLPGNADAIRPYNISLGASLAQAPVVAAALGFLALAHGPLPRGEASALLRSRHFPGAWELRARSERIWLEESRRDVDWHAALSALERYDAPLAMHWRSAREGAARVGSQSPREWTATWRSMLAAAGWPGDGPLTSAQFEARQAFEKLLEEFARIAGVESSLRAAPALRALSGLARRTVFQPESPPTAISILGLLEAAGQTFDALWIAGLSAQRWPPAPSPQPFLPVRWQRDRGLPHASAARELAYARMLTDVLARGAPSVVMSHAEFVDEHEAAPSLLIPAAAAVLSLPPRRESSAQQIAGARAVVAVADFHAPVLAEGPQRGGAGIIARQSDCPFRAFARDRLRVDCWPRAAEGLDYRERGQLMHQALANFWRVVGTQAELLRLDTDAQRAAVDSAVAEAAATLPASRWRLLPRAVAAAEASRVAQVAGVWLDTIEKPRGDFRALLLEWPTTLTMAGLTFKLKVDRVDALASGGYAVIDYKTGQVDTPPTWFYTRPRAPQIGLYALALAAKESPDAVRAAVYGKVKAGEVAAFGIAADGVVWPRLTPAAKLPGIAGWSGAQIWWRDKLTGLAQELRDGVATVTPREGGKPCRTCGLQSLCRIGAVANAGEDDDDR